MSDDTNLAKTKRKTGWFEMIALLATVIPCCLGTFAFLGYERLQDLLPFTREPVPTQTVIVAPSFMLPNPPRPTPTQATPRRAADTPFDLKGVWNGYFNDAGFNEFSDYRLELTQQGSNLSGTATAISPGNPNCQSSRPIRGTLDSSAKTVKLTETLGGATTCPTFPRGSAGELKTFTLAYETTEGSPMLRGTWQEVYGNAWTAPGEITFSQQR